MNTTASSLLAPRTAADAPEGSRATLENIRKAFGFVPNLMATFANSPAVLNGYLALDGQFNQSGFSALERELILLAVSVENGCNYCASAHSTFLKGPMKTDAALVDAVRDGRPLADHRLQALVSLVREIVAQRGHASDATIKAFLAAGYRPEQVAEVLLGVALKTISNYLDALNPVAVDAPFIAESRR